MKLKTHPLFIFALLLIGFNLWHNTTRRIWNGSFQDSLTIGPDVLELARRSHPDLQIDKPYDGQFYYAIAHDPLLISKESLPFVNPAKYRYRRVLLPALAYAVAFGQPRALIYSIFFVNVVAWVLCAFFAFKIAEKNFERPRLAATGVLTITGLTFAAFRSLPEPVAMALLLGGCYYFLEHRPWRAAVFFGLACLARETAALAPVALVLHQRFIEKKPVRHEFGFLAAAILPAILWTAYLSICLGAQGQDIPFTQHFSWPYMGLWKDFQLARVELTTGTERIRAYSIMIALLAVSNVVYFFHRKFRSLWGTLALAEAILCSVVYGTIWSYHSSGSRVVAPLMVFALLWALDGAAQDTGKD